MKHDTEMCPRCEKEFVCCAGDILQCQCQLIELDEKVSSMIDTLYPDECLCFDCLEEINNKGD
jgi:hypothetical protein